MFDIEIELLLLKLISAYQFYIPRITVLKKELKKRIPSYLITLI